jgi:hypothetical protein
MRTPLNLASSLWQGKYVHSSSVGPALCRRCPTGADHRALACKVRELAAENAVVIRGLDKNAGKAPVYRADLGPIRAKSVLA